MSPVWHFAQSRQKSRYKRKADKEEEMKALAIFIIIIWIGLYSWMVIRLKKAVDRLAKDCEKLKKFLQHE